MNQDKLDSTCGVTEIKAEESLKDNEQKYKLLVNSLNSIVMTIDNHLRITYMNKYGLDFFGYSMQEILGKSVLGTTIPLKDDKGVDLAQMTQDIIKNPQKYKTNIHKNMRKNGKLVWVSWTNNPRYDQDGNLLEILAVGNDISELKKAEDALHESEERFSTAFHINPTAMAITKMDGRMVDVNNSFLSLVGFSRQEVIGKSGVELGLYADKSDREALLNQLEKSGVLLNHELTFVHKSGRIVNTIFSLIRITLNGEPHLLGSAIDITKRKKAEEALKENERLYKAVFDNSQDGFLMAEVLYDEDGRPCDNRILKVNSVFTKQADIKSKDIIGRKLKDLGRSIEQSWLDTQNSVLRTGKSIHFENYSQETKRYYDIYMFPITRTIFGELFRDITERKKAQEEIERSSQRINEILESISDDFMVLNHNWNFVYANRQAAKLVGLEPKDIVGKNFWDLFPQNKDTYVEQNLREAMEDQKIRRFELFGQYSKMHKLITTYPSVEGIVLIATDITERKSLEDQLHEKERLAAIGATAGMVGHDIRNPLQAMMSDVYLLKELLIAMPQMQTKDEVAESLDGLEKNISYVNKIVADLQDYARPLKPEYSMVYLPDVVTSIFKTVELPDNIKLLIDVKAPDKVETEATFIRRSLTNLVNNAIQAMPDGGNLTILVSEAQNRLLITVEDTGVGIPEEVKPKLFSPMTTTKAKGQGLGLAVVKRLVEALNGNITFESQKGKGTKFIIELPLTKPKAATNS